MQPSSQWGSHHCPLGPPLSSFHPLPYPWAHGLASLRWCPVVITEHSQHRKKRTLLLSYHPKSKLLLHPRASSGRKWRSREVQPKRFSSFLGLFGVFGFQVVCDQPPSMFVLATEVAGCVKEISLQSFHWNLDVMCQSLLS